MKKNSFLRLLLILSALVFGLLGRAGEVPGADSKARMKWWREARFGLFIHWGLYAIPAGEWQGRTDYGEWIRHSAKIPLDEYEGFVTQFNPLKFDADAWVRLAKKAGMKYIVITSKHHDGFCLFDSKYTDFDVMATPFKRDVLQELAAACRREGLRICWYHSIMDWHHPDYLPRREWEKDRSSAGADFGRYLQYMKNQLTELLTNYGPVGVLWFDGEWESTWNDRNGRELYDYVRALQPAIIVNNRVGVSRAGSMEGFGQAGEQIGDFGTPEQQVPSGLPGVDWETCMTMNDHWGYNRSDANWKSGGELIRTLVDVVSKGGNYLLNVGPTAEGVFPQASIERLEEIGRWMQVNGEAIRGTAASPFAGLPWGRCTQKAMGGRTRLYLHVFDWPPDGRLVLRGIFNRPLRAYLLSDPGRARLPVTRNEDALEIRLPENAPDRAASVVVLDVKGEADVSRPPVIEADHDIFTGMLPGTIRSDRRDVEIRYTLDGSLPTLDSSLYRAGFALDDTTVVSARLFRSGRPVSDTAQKKFVRVQPRPAAAIANPAAGVCYDYYEGEWERLPDFSALKPRKSGTQAAIDLSAREREDRFAFSFSGFIRVPESGVYTFFTASDDGSRLYVGDELVVDNDGLHGLKEARGEVALATGLHPVRVLFFECTGSEDLQVSFSGPGMAKQPLPSSMLFHQE